MDPLTELFEAVIVVLVLTVICRWVFGARGVRRSTPRPDYGLLTPVLRTDTDTQAQSAHRTLEAAGIRSTVAPAGLGFTASGRQWPADAKLVLVFAPDVAAAEALLRPAPPRRRAS